MVTASRITGADSCPCNFASLTLVNAPSSNVKTTRPIYPYQFDGYRVPTLEPGVRVHPGEKSIIDTGQPASHAYVVHWPSRRPTRWRVVFVFISLFGVNEPFKAFASDLETLFLQMKWNWCGCWQLTPSQGGHIVCAISEWCVYESTGFHLGNIGSNFFRGEEGLKDSMQDF